MKRRNIFAPNKNADPNLWYKLSSNNKSFSRSSSSISDFFVLSKCDMHQHLSLWWRSLNWKIRELVYERVCNFCNITNPLPFIFTQVLTTIGVFLASFTRRGNTYCMHVHFYCKIKRVYCRGNAGFLLILGETILPDRWEVLKRLKDA